MRFDLPRLTGQVLYDVVHRKSATAGSLDDWGWKELKVLACFLGLMSLLVFLLWLKDNGDLA